MAVGEDYHYGYDGLGQVMSSDRGNLNINCTTIAATPNHAETWDYDPTGNWHGYEVEADGAVVLAQGRTHDKGNRLIRVNAETSPFSLDRVGRTTQAEPDASGDWNSSLKFKWDAWNRITAVRRASDDALLAEYGYDGLSRRVSRKAGDVIRDVYYSNTWKPLEEREASETTASVQYLWGVRHRDDLVRRDRDSNAGGALNEIRYVLMDYYSPLAIVDEAGEVTERYDFSAFGLRRVLQPDFSSRSTSECNFDFGFQGQFLDGESGLMNYGYRYYSPHLGRWMCKDPMEEHGGLNLYEMSKNSPVNQVDLLGLFSIPWPPRFPELPIGNWPPRLPSLPPLPRIPNPADWVNEKIAQAEAIYECLRQVRTEGHHEYPGVDNDAGRHCWASCTASKRCGSEDIARLAGIINELQGLGIDLMNLQTGAFEMDDLDFNEMGFDCAKTAADEAECHCCCQEKVG